MIIIDWRDPVSLGNIVATAYASEYIRNTLKQDVGIIPADYHQNVYKLSVPPEKIFNAGNIPPNSEVRVPHLNNYNHKNNLPDEKSLPWVHNLVASAGYWMEGKLDPYICWVHSPGSKRVLLYPREHHNKNLYFTMDYWVKASQRFLDNGWEIVAILHDGPSHRDYEMSPSWCNEFRSRIECSYIFTPTIQGLQIAVGLCDLAFGILSGPFWLMLKSTIRQIVLSDPNDKLQSHHAGYNIPYIKKQLVHIPNNSLDFYESIT